MNFPPRPFLVAKLPSLVSGVDFLGLGAVNERLIADFLPGISNVTRYMRVYSAMTWMAWRFDQHFRTEGRNLSQSEIRKRFARFREKVELLFTWGNLKRGPGIVGSERRFPKNQGAQRLAFSEFGSVAISWLDAAVYGPSLKVNNGLGFIEPRPGSSLGPTGLGAELAAALDASLRRSRYYTKLCDVDDDVGSLQMAEDLGERWSILASTKDERDAFRKAFAPARALPEVDPAGAARNAAVRLIHDALRRLGGSGSQQAVREAIAKGSTDASPQIENLDEPARALWTALQVRQLQRLCHEMLLRWVELALIDPPVGISGLTTGHLARHCGETAARHLRLSVQDPLSELTALVVQQVGRRKSPLVAGGPVDPFNVIQQLEDLKGSTHELEQIPGVAVRGLTIAAVQTLAFAGDNNFVRPISLGHASRLSLQTLVDLFRSHQNKPLGDFVDTLIESCTVGQHFATVASKLEPGKNKYRFVPSELGLKPLIDPDKVIRAGVTHDRLEIAMSLMCDCGLLTRTADPEAFGLPPPSIRSRV